MTDKTPTNTTILKAIMELSNNVAENQALADSRHLEYSKEFKSMQKRQDHTNGSVTDLLLWQSNMKAVDAYKLTQEDRNPIQAIKVDARSSPFGWKEILAGLGVLATAIALAVAQLASNN